MKRYLKVWFQLAHISFADEITTRFSSMLFVIGKTLRFVFFLIFLFTLVNHTGGLAGYSKVQVVIFFLVFNLVDTIAQLFLRGIYFFRSQVVSGEFDFFLIKPMNPLFRVLAGYTDFLDFVTLIGLVGYMIWFIRSELPQTNGTDLVGFGIMLMLGLTLALAMHIIVAAVGVVTTEVDHTIWSLRDLTLMARVPIDIYVSPIREILTFLIPIAVMITFPAKALLGLLSPGWVVFSLFLVTCFLLFSLRFWKYALSQYSSASS